MKDKYATCVYVADIPVLPVSHPEHAESQEDTKPGNKSPIYKKNKKKS